MNKYRLTNKAVDDLTQIWEYAFNKWSKSQADKYYQMLIDNFDEIALNPDLGEKYSIITEDLFGFRAGRHIIFYRRIKENSIEVIRTIHEIMDLRNRINE